MTVIPTHLSIITLNCNNVKSPIIIHRLSEWIKKHNPTLLSARNSIIMIGMALNKSMEKGLPNKQNQEGSKLCSLNTG